MKKNNLLWSAAPVVALVGVSLASVRAAPNATLTALLVVDGNNAYQGHRIFDCSKREGTYVEAHATAYDACGNFVQSDTADVIGSSASAQFPNTQASGHCGLRATEHQAWLQARYHNPSNGTETVTRYPDLGPKSGCWNTDLGTGACISLSKATLTSGIEGFDASCASARSHNVQGFSFGSSP